MGDMSRCEHGDFQSYCRQCNPNGLLMWDDDGNAFLCMVCGESVPRTRDNPYPGHKCKDATTSTTAKDK